MARVSVVIPTFNAAAFIAEALETVFAQTYKDFEVVVVDDGSTDGTWQALEPYADRICCFRQSNEGPARARNTAIKASSGTYVAFLDVDDLWVPEKLQLQIAFLQAHPDIDLVFGNVEEFDDRGVTQPSFFATRRNAAAVATAGRISDAFERLLDEYLIPTSTVLLRRAVLDEVGFFDASFRGVGEDRDLWLRVARRGGIGCLPVKLARKRLHASNVSSGWENEDGLLAYIRIFTKVERNWNSLGLRSRALVTRNLSRLFRSLGELYLAEGRRVLARRAFTRSLRYSFSRRALLFWGVSCLSWSTVGRLRSLKRRLSSG